MLRFIEMSNADTRNMFAQTQQGLLRPEAVRRRKAPRSPKRCGPYPYELWAFNADICRLQLSQTADAVALEGCSAAPRCPTFSTIRTVASDTRRTCNKQQQQQAAAR